MCFKCCVLVLLFINFADKLSRNYWYGGLHHVSQRLFTDIVHQIVRRDFLQRLFGLLHQWLDFKIFSDMPSRWVVSGKNTSPILTQSLLSGALLCAVSLETKNYMKGSAGHSRWDGKTGSSKSVAWVLEDAGGLGETGMLFEGAVQVLNRPGSGRALELAFGREWGFRMAGSRPSEGGARIYPAADWMPPSHWDGWAWSDRCSWQPSSQSDARLKTGSMVSLKKIDNKSQQNTTN